MTTKEKFTRKLFKFNYKGYACIVANYKHDVPKLSSGVSKETIKILKDMSDWWCGYVILNTSSSHYGKAYDDIDIQAHGGLTYSGLPPSEKKGFAIGFDMNHAEDKGGSRIKAAKGCMDIVDQL